MGEKSGTPPCKHLDVIVMTDKEYERGDKDCIKIVGVFQRNDGEGWFGRECAEEIIHLFCDRFGFFQENRNAFIQIRK